MDHMLSVLQLIWGAFLSTYGWLLNYYKVHAELMNETVVMPFESQDIIKQTSKKNILLVQSRILAVFWLPSFAFNAQILFWLNEEPGIFILCRGIRLVRR